MKFIESTSDDIDQLEEWIAQDPYHKDCLDPLWWLTGVEGSFLCFCLQDSHGPTMYVRTDKENDLLRLHIQFGPESEVSKHRVVKSIIRGWPQLEYIRKQEQMKGFIFRSKSKSLINFMEAKFGFMTSQSGNDDYILAFEDN